MKRRGGTTSKEMGDGKETRDQRSEIRSQRTEDREQRSGNDEGMTKHPPSRKATALQDDKTTDNWTAARSAALSVISSPLSGEVPVHYPTGNAVLLHKHKVEFAG